MSVQPGQRARFLLPAVTMRRSIAALLLLLVIPLAAFAKVEQRTPTRTGASIRRATRAAQAGNPSIRRELLQQIEDRHVPVVERVDRDAVLKLKKKTPVRSTSAVRRATRAAAIGNPAQRRKIAKA